MAKSQGKPQGKEKKREIRSPRNGAVTRTLRPGETANPAGSSAKQRLKAALNRAVSDGVADEFIAGMLKDAKQKKSGSLRAKNRELVLKAAGLMKADDVDAGAPRLDVVVLVKRDHPVPLPLPDARAHDVSIEVKAK